MEIHCPECNSEDVIPWDDGFICRDCGVEFGGHDDLSANEEDA